MGNSQGTVRCETQGHGAAAGGPTPDSHPKAFPEYTMQIPLGPKMDEEQAFGLYKNHDESMGPFPEAFDFVNKLKVTEEQVNQTYDHNLSHHMSLDGNRKPPFSSNWERLVAYHHGTYMPEAYQPAKTADEIRLEVANYAEKVHQDAPKDACKYLQIEEFRCLNVHQFESQPQVAAKKCMKWWDEWQKCQWDQAKFNSGTTYIEGPQMRRRRPYIFYPDFKYA